MADRISLDKGWRLHVGEIPQEPTPLKSPMYTEAKLEHRRTGPAARYYDDRSDFYSDPGLITHTEWRSVDVPFDYILEGKPDPSENQALGCFPYVNAWARRHFTPGSECAGKRVSICFEGVSIHCEVWFNGCYVTGSLSGYAPFEADITDLIEPERDNVLAVHILTDDHESWWYEGAGIYRHVWLEIASPVSIDHRGVFIHPEKTGSAWNVPVDVEVRNDGFSDAGVTAVTVLRDPEGREVARTRAEGAVRQGERTVLSSTCAVTSPELWDTDSPSLYTAETELFSGDALSDTSRVRFGFRTAVFDPDRGFFLNGRHLKLKGVCCHQDFGLTGKAVPERMQKYKLQLLKQMGANAYRTAHYPHHEYTMDMMDELGILVMDETRLCSSAPEGIRQLETLVKRDRNHPCVILWSLGNEEPLHSTDVGKRVLLSMRRAVRRLDTSRPVTCAVDRDVLTAPALDAVDVIGINYNLDDWDRIHALHPDKPFVVTENSASGTTRGWYHADDPRLGYVNGYDRDISRTFRAREITWQSIASRDYIAGGFQWTGIEYRGETTWPRMCSQSGAIDLFMQKKDAFYQNLSHWSDKPMAHLLPHWNFRGLEGVPVRVVCYTNCEEAELFLNGRSLGNCSVPPCGHAEWSVPYEPGVLTVSARTNGKELARDAVSTSGPAAAPVLTLMAEPEKGPAGGTCLVDLSCVDQAGLPVPDAEGEVTFSVTGPARILSTGSDVSDNSPVFSPRRRMRMGHVTVLLALEGDPAPVTLFAVIAGLPEAHLTIFPAV